MHFEQYRNRIARSRSDSLSKKTYSELDSSRAPELRIERFETVARELMASDLPQFHLRVSGFGFASHSRSAVFTTGKPSPTPALLETPLYYAHTKRIPCLASSSFSSSSSSCSLLNLSEVVPSQQCFGKLCCASRKLVASLISGRTGWR